MKKSRLFILILGVLLFSGCTTYKYQGNAFPSLSSSSFPSFTPVSEINDGIKINLAEASLRTKLFMNFNISSRGQQNIPVRSSLNGEWDVNVVNNLIYNNFFMEGTVDTPNKSIPVKVRCEGIHEMSGKEIKLAFSSETKEGELTSEQLASFKRQMSDYINAQSASLGKTVKTGDVLKYIPNDFSGITEGSQSNIRNTIPEVIKGLGVYKSKKVVVTEYTLEDSIHDSETIKEIRGKGYNLYDTESFIQLYGESVVYVTLFSQKEGSVYIKANGGYEAYDVKVRNIIDLPTSTGRGASKESGKSANERLEGLKRLKDKSLITDEEYEKKKKQILDEL